jgi:hypothetical protein
MPGSFTKLQPYARARGVALRDNFVHKPDDNQPRILATAIRG